MAFEIIQGFNNSSNSPLDIRFIATSEADMLGIKWVYEGLIVARIDTSPIKLFICTAASAPNGSNPYTTIGDWEEFTGTAGLDGTDGSQIYANSGDPSDVLGVDGDFYINNSSGDFFLKSGGTWGIANGNLIGPQGIQGPEGAAGADGDLYATTSTTSVDLTAAAGSETIIVAADLSYTVGQDVIVASRANPLVNNFTGTVTSYSGTSLILGSVTYNGSGTLTDWDVNLTGAAGPAGASCASRSPPAA